MEPVPREHEEASTGRVWNVITPVASMPHTHVPILTAPPQAPTHPGGQARLECQLTQAQCRHRGLLCHLERGREGRGICSATWREEGRGRGVWLLTFRTTVLPAASAGAIFQAAMRSGKFQGMICAHTPTGSCSV